MYKTSIRLFFFISIILACALVFSYGPGHVFAKEEVAVPTQGLEVPDAPPATGTNLSVSPVFLNLTTDPGKPVHSQIEVTNNNNFKEYLEMDIVKFEVGNDGNGLRLQKVDDADEFVGWVQFDEQQFALDPNEHKKVSFSITPDKNAALGYYYALVVKRIKDARIKDTTTLAGYPAVPLILGVRSPYAKRELQLVDFLTDKLFYEYLPAAFTIKVKNTGNIHVVPVGDIFIDWGGAKNIATMRANEGRSNVLPQSERLLTAKWDEGFVVAREKDDGKRTALAWDFTKIQKFRIGKYTAHLLLVYDNGERDIPLEAQVSFWVVPWRLILVILAILLTPITMLRIGLLIVTVVGNNILLGGNPLIFLIAVALYIGLTFALMKHGKNKKK